MSLNTASLPQKIVVKIPIADQVNGEIVYKLPGSFVKSSFRVLKVTGEVTGTPGASKSITFTVNKSTTALGTFTIASNSSSVVTAGSYDGYTATTTSAGLGTGPAKIKQSEYLSIVLSEVTAFTGIIFLYIEIL